MVARGHLVEQPRREPRPAPEVERERRRPPHHGSEERRRRRLEHRGDQAQAIGGDVGVAVGVARHGAAGSAVAARSSMSVARRRVCAGGNDVPRTTSTRFPRLHAKTVTAEPSAFVPSRRYASSPSGGASAGRRAGQLAVADVRDVAPERGRCPDATREDDDGRLDDRIARRELPAVDAVGRHEDRAVRRQEPVVGQMLLLGRVARERDDVLIAGERRHVAEAGRRVARGELDRRHVARAEGPGRTDGRGGAARWGRRRRVVRARGEHEQRPDRRPPHASCVHAADATIGPCETCAPSPRWSSTSTWRDRCGSRPSANWPNAAAARSRTGSVRMTGGASTASSTSSTTTSRPARSCRPRRTSGGSRRSSARTSPRTASATRRRCSARATTRPGSTTGTARSRRCSTDWRRAGATTASRSSCAPTSCATTGRRTPSARSRSR